MITNILKSLNYIKTGCGLHDKSVSKSKIEKKTDHKRQVSGTGCCGVSRFQGKHNLVPRIQRNEDAVVVEVVSRRVHG